MTKSGAVKSRATKNGVVGNVLNKSGRFVGDVFSGVGKFVGNVTPKSMKRSMRKRMTGGKTRKHRKSKKSRK